MHQPQHLHDHRLGYSVNLLFKIDAYIFQIIDRTRKCKSPLNSTFRAVGKGKGKRAEVMYADVHVQVIPISEVVMVVHRCASYLERPRVNGPMVDSSDLT